MSTLKPHPCLLKLLAALGLALPLGVVPAGCSSTSGLRTGSNSKMKTFLAVGDKPLPVVSGEPGSTITAEADGEHVAPRRKDARPEGRISGRVFDADGRPVPEARVRLAVSGVPGGKVVRASTDRSGAFTLHGLRPGSDYTVIAEWEDEAGVMTGRANARASDTDVRISLASQDDPPARAAGKARVNRVSEREAADAEQRDEADEEPTGSEGESSGKVRPAGRVNEEDLPPADEAEAMAPPPRDSESTRGATSTRHNRTVTVDSTPWAKGRRRPEPEPAPAEPAGEGAEPEARSAGSTTLPAESEAPDDDVPNPLPPAIEPGQAPSAAAEPDPGPAPTGVASSEPDPFVGEPPRVAMTDPFVEPQKPTRPLAASSAFESPTRPSSPPVARLQTTDEPPPGALVVAPETFGPVLVHDAPPFNPNGPVATDPFVEPAPKTRTAAKPTERPTRPRRPNTSSRPSASEGKATTGTTDSSTSAAATNPTPSRRRPTWGDIAATTKELPPFENEAVETAATPKSDARVGVVRRTSTAPAEGRNVALAKTTDPLAPACEYDDRHRQIIDFRLPDLDGKPVRFQDLDADLVLIDFWGTWCQPCIKSIPHLVDLQERLGKRLAVVGIACEPDTFEKATTRVAETARRLKVNYPILLSRNDGSCPLQEALHVQAFPTMVLVDREGRVLWRDQGATPTTLARLDHFLETSTGSDRTVVR